MSITRAPASVGVVNDVPLTTRNADLADLAAMLKDQQSRKVDVVAPASAIESVEGHWMVDGTEPVLTASGVDTTTGSFLPTEVADEGLGEKLGVPRQYLRRLRSERIDLYDANVNGWLHGRPAVDDVPASGPDPRKFMVRTFRGDGGVGVARAFLSDRYRIVDNLDVLMAALEGVRASGVDTEVTACDLTERRMYVKLAAPDVQVLAPDLLGDYRSPFDGTSGSDVPVVFAGFVLQNSEVGAGAWSLVPRITFRVCDNGMTITKDAFRHVHLGAKLDEGVVRWSDETQQRNLELVTSMSRDAVATFLNVDYLRGVLDRLREKAGKPVEDAAGTVERVVREVRMTAHQDAVLEHFIRGGSMTAGGVMNAVTSVAQTLEDADAAADVEAAAFDALVSAAR